MVAYNRDIPDGPNNPSVDQPKMKQNTNSIDTLLAVDHISFNASNGGQHTSIHFNQDASYVPIPPVSPPQLFTESMGGKIALKYYSGDTANTSDNYVISGTSGSTMLFGGVILKWFSASFVGASLVVTFASKGINDFPNNVFGATISANSTGTAVAITSVSTTQVNLSRGSVIVPQTVFVMVLGN